MKTKLTSQLLCLWLLPSSFSLPVFAQSTAFTYQGRLNDGSAPAHGSYELRLSVFDDATAGNLRGLQTNRPVAVSNGLFTTTIDFGSGVFNGGPRWLELGVRSNGTLAEFTTVSPRQRILPAPYAMWAADAAQAQTISGTVPASGLNGVYSNPVSFSHPANGFAGDGGGLNNVNAAQLGGRTAAQFWQTGGNVGTAPGTDFLGTTDNQALELRVNNQRALRIEPNTNRAPNVIAGSPFNHASNTVMGATIAGGGGISAAGDAYTNRVTADFGTVGGGVGNTAGGTVATVGGGIWNLAGGGTATVGGGYGNVASGQAATISGGNANTAIGFLATISGGFLNSASGSNAFVGGGRANAVVGDYGVAAGGYLNSVGAGSPYATVGGGYQNKATSPSATVAGGAANTASNHWSFVGGGDSNVAGGDRSAVVGGLFNLASGGGGIIGGGERNTASGSHAAVPGGYLNTAGGRFSFAAGRQARALHDGSFVWADQQETDFDSTTTNQFNVRASGGARFETGGAGLTVDGRAAFLAPAPGQPQEFFVNSAGAWRLMPTATSPNIIGGYAGNVVSNGVVGAFIGGGGNASFPNRIGGDYAAVLGGFGNVASGVNATAFGNQCLAAGYGSTAFGIGAQATDDSAVAMGRATRAGGFFSTAMGHFTEANGNYSTAMGDGSKATGASATALGSYTTAGGIYSTAMGGGTTATGNWATAMGRATLAGGVAATAMGQNTTASGDWTTAMGYRARANHFSSFVWADSQNTDFPSTGANQFSIRASGGVRLNNDTSLNFGNQTRQMINLWNTEYGIGVQSDTTYFRSGNDFAWFKGGSHEDAAGSPGLDGSVLMRLSRDGNLGLGTTPAYVLDVARSQAVGRFTTILDANGAVLVLKNVRSSPTYLGAINFENDSTTAGQIGYLASDQMSFRVGGQDRMNLSASGLTVNGTFVSSSDRNAKADFASVDAQEMLEKVAALPLQSWSYTNRPGVKHVGPMAQDFRAAFGLGEDDKHIATVDADGVALAAIQGLNRKVEQKETEIKELKTRLVKLEQLVNQKLNGDAQ